MKKKTVGIQIGEGIEDLKYFKVEDGSVIVLKSESVLPPEKKREIQNHMTQQLKDTFGFEKIHVLVVEAGKTVSALNLNEKDLLLVNMSGKYYSHDGARAMVQNIKNVLDTIGLMEKIGIIVVREPADLAIMDDHTLLDLGLMKVDTLLKGLGQSKFFDLMDKLGFEQVKSDTAALIDPNTPSTDREVKELKYIVHPSDSIGFFELCKKYGVDADECYNGQKLSVDVNQAEYYHLYPRLNNVYKIPSKKGR